MNEKIKEFYTELYFYLKKNDISINISKSYGKSYMTFSEKKSANEHSYISIDYFLDYFEDNSSITFYEKSFNIVKDFYIYYYKNNPDKQEILGKKIISIVNFSFWDSYHLNNFYNTLRCISETPKNFLNILKRISLKELPLPFIKLAKIHDILDNQNATFEEKHNVFYTILKQRQTALKFSNKEIEEIKQFLIDLYEKNNSKDKLSTYFPFFPLLKDMFEEMEVNITEKDYTYTTSVSLNLHKILISFPSKNWNIYNYEAILDNFIQTFKNFYHLKDANYLMKNKKIMTLHLYHDNPSINNDVFKKETISFLKNIYKMEPNDVNPDFIKSLLLKNKLEQSTENLNNQIYSKRTNKI